MKDNENNKKYKNNKKLKEKYKNAKVMIRIK